jgi:hypothetical protein
MFHGTGHWPLATRHWALAYKSKPLTTGYTHCLLSIANCLSHTGYRLLVQKSIFNILY